MTTSTTPERGTDIWTTNAPDALTLRSPARDPRRQLRSQGLRGGGTSRAGLPRCRNAQYAEYEARFGDVGYRN
jgi:hypothetical protein